jgi:putative serine protease PepD
MAHRDRLWARPRADADAPPYRGRPWLAEVPREPEPPPPPPPPRPKKSRRGAIIGSLVAALTAGAVVAAVLLFIGQDDGKDTAKPLAAAAGGGRGLSARAIYASASPGVVSIAAKEGRGTSTGTGFLIDANGTIVTNAHVVGQAGTVQVQFGDQGTQLDAPVLGRDVSSDLAVVRVDPRQAGTLHPLPLADSDSIRVGDPVVAIGNPFRLDRTATAGIVSALDRHITAPNGFDIDGVIQTDAPINPGNSGGPLLDGQARVVGVNSQIETGNSGGGNVGIGFAVPSNTVRQIVPRLEKGQTVEHAYLGVSTTKATGRKGALVTSAKGPAARTGIRRGDIITTIGGKEIEGPGDVAGAVNAHQPNEVIGVEVVHPDGSREEFHVPLTQRPNNAGP